MKPKLFERIGALFKAPPAPVPTVQNGWRVPGLSSVPNARGVKSRMYAGAMGGRLTADWVSTNLSADAEIRGNLQRLRDRARDLERNNDYARRFLGEAEVNILGHKGIKFAARSAFSNGKLDEKTNSAVKSAWNNWALPANASTSRQLSFRRIEKLAIRSMFRDGEFLARIVRGFNNPHAFALQPFEPDLLDHNFNRTTSRGENKISMGVEMDDWDQPVAYWLWLRHPGDIFGQSAGDQRRMRVPASDILHVYIRERVGQSRGVTAFCSPMTRMQMLSGYEEAEVTAARISACQMGFFTTPAVEGEQFTGDDTDPQGNQIVDAEPGTFNDLPYGKDFKPFNPQHPNGNYNDFRKGVLRGIAAGLGVGYNGLAMDLESVNYSSLRSGMLDEREFWMSMQEEAIEQLHQKVFDAWFEMQFLTSTIKAPQAKLEKFTPSDACRWMGRRWPWVDPAKDASADILSLNARTTSRSQLCADRGDEFDEVLDQIAADEALAKEKGVELTPVPIAATTKNPVINAEGETGKPADPANA